MFYENVSLMHVRPVVVSPVRKGDHADVNYLPPPGRFICRLFSGFYASTKKACTALVNDVSKSKLVVLLSSWHAENMKPLRIAILGVPWLARFLGMAARPIG